MQFFQPEPTHVCENTNCALEWEVKPDHNERQLWHFRGRKGVFTVAFHKPTCPLCGEELLELAALESTLIHFHLSEPLEAQQDTHSFRP